MILARGVPRELWLPLRSTSLVRLPILTFRQISICLINIVCIHGVRQIWVQQVLHYTCVATLIDSSDRLSSSHCVKFFKSFLLLLLSSGDDLLLLQWCFNHSNFVIAGMLRSVLRLKHLVEVRCITFLCKWCLGGLALPRSRPDLFSFGNQRAEIDPSPLVCFPISIGSFLSQNALALLFLLNVLVSEGV